MTWRTLKGIKCLIKAEVTDYNSIHLNNSWTLVIFPSRQTYNLAVLCTIILKWSTIFIYLRKRIRILSSEKIGFHTVNRGRLNWLSWYRLLISSWLSIRPFRPCSVLSYHILTYPTISSSTLSYPAPSCPYS